MRNLEVKAFVSIANYVCIFRAVVVMVVVEEEEEEAISLS